MEYQLQSYARSGSNRHDYENSVRHFRRESELQFPSPEDSRGELEFDVQPITDDAGFAAVLSQYYGPNDASQYDTRRARLHEKATGASPYSRQSEMRSTTGESSTTSQHYRPNSSSSIRHRLAGSAAARYSDPQAGVYDESFQYAAACGGTTDRPFAIRYCDATSSLAAAFPHRSATPPPIKTSPDDDDDDEIPPPLTHRLPPGAYWSAGCGLGAAKDAAAAAGVWRAADQLDNSASFGAGGGGMRQPPAAATASPVYGPTTSFIKVEDSPSSNPQDPTPPADERAQPVDRNPPAAAAAACRPAPPRRRKRPDPSPSGSRAVPPPAGPGARPSAPESASPAAAAAAAARLPFSLPPVPPGYRLVITHRPTPETSDDAARVTQLIIDHPTCSSDSTTLIRGNAAAAAGERTCSAPSADPAPASARPVTNHQWCIGGGGIRGYTPYTNLRVF